MSIPQKRKKYTNSSLPAINPELAQRHIAAYYFALYGNCNCEACTLLRPIAEKIAESLKKGKGKVIEEVGKEG